jgi:uncharacterized membrane protein
VTRRRLLAQLNRARVEAAVAEAETSSTGEIRVSIAGWFWGPSRWLAERAFRRLRMAETRDRNGVLLLVLPWRRQLVILGDQGIDGRVAAGFWQGVIADAAIQMRAGRFTEGLCGAVAAVGRVLAQEFPVREGEANGDELVNRIE